MFDKNYGWSLYIVKNMYKILDTSCVYEYGCGCFLNFFLLENALK